MSNFVQMRAANFSSFMLIPLAIFILFLYRRFSDKDLSLPPSPPKLPVIGNLHQLGSQPHRSLKSLAQIYGPLMLLHFGSVPVLIVSSAEGACEILKTQDLIFSDRARSIFLKKLAYNFRGLVFAPYGEYWRRLKSICVLNLMSSSKVSSFRVVREQETELMINNIKQFCSSSSVLNLSEMFLRITNDVICRIALGRKYNDPGEEGRGTMFMDLAAEFTKLMTYVNIGDYIPWLSWFTRVNGLNAKVDSLSKRLDDFLDMVIQEHMDSSNSKNTPGQEDGGRKDIVDVLLSIQKENTSGVPIDTFSMKAIILDMFLAGTDSTSSLMEWAMSELLRHPRVMKKLQNEVRKIAGNKTNILTEDDLVGMDYLKAVIKETLRLHAMLMPRMSNKDTKINGYNIKRGTLVLVNLWQIGRDPKSYDKPDEFEPERFLKISIDYKGNDDFQFIPFGGGRRGCPGIQFAMALEEIALANMVHKFDWVLPDGAKVEDLDMTEASGVSTHRRCPLKAVAIPYPHCI